MDQYRLHSDFRAFRRLQAPVNPFAIAVAQKLLRPSKSALRSDERVSAETVRFADDVPPGIVYRPRGKPKAALVYFPGGGFVFPPAPQHYRLARRYAAEGELVVFFARYRLAPAHPYPTPAEDACRAYAWVAAHAEEFGVPPDRVMLGGDSAGGALAVTTAFRAKDRGMPLPSALFLVYPFLDFRLNSVSSVCFSDAPVWNTVLSARALGLYAPAVKGPRRYFSPAEASDVSFLPPAYIETAEYDSLHDDGVLFAERLKAAGVPCVLRETKGTMHGFDQLRRTPFVESLIAERVGALRAAARSSSFGDCSAAEEQNEPPMTAP